MAAAGGKTWKRRGWMSAVLMLADMLARAKSTAECSSARTSGAGVKTELFMRPST
jgi:hypothetical protein